MGLDLPSGILSADEDKEEEPQRQQQGGIPSDRSASDDTVTEVFQRLSNYISQPRSTLTNTFLELDRDGMGVVDSEDFSFALTSLGFDFDEYEVALILDRVDPSGEGIVHYRELAQACRKFGGKRHATAPSPPAPPPGKAARPTTPGRGAERGGSRGRSRSRQHERGPSVHRDPPSNYRPASSRGASPRRGASPGRGGATEERGSIYYSRFRKGYSKLVQAANKSLSEVTSTVIKTLRQVIQAYRPPIALVCLEAVCLIVYEKAPQDQAEALAFLKQADLRESLLKASPESLSQTGVCRLRQLLYKMSMMEYNQIGSICVLTNWMEKFEKAAQYYNEHSKLLKNGDELNEGFDE